MANDMCKRRLTRELQAINKTPLLNPRVYTTPLESNILEWHYVIEGSKDTPYEGGYYWGKLVFPREYPLKPPSVIMLTPNGRFKTGRRLCLSMSDFHPESWNPMWSVSTIITGLISFMVETSPTLGSIETSTSQKKRYAQVSLDYNVRDPQFAKLFPELVSVHKEKLEERIKLLGPGGAEKANAELMKVTSEDGADGLMEMQGVMAGIAGFVALISFIFAIRFF